MELINVILEEVESFKYLGAAIAINGEMKLDVILEIVEMGMKTNIKLY